VGLLFFVHIEKTAATSVRRSVIEPNMTCRSVGRLHTEILDATKGREQADCLYGHVGYGFHRFVRDDVDYVTMLRDPVDRAISFYYFVKDLDRTDICERHRLRDYADSVTVAQFFENPRFANTQTRRLAGIEFDHAYPYLSWNGAFRRAMLEAAKRHLLAMPVFGLREQFAESQRRFLQYVGGGKCMTGLTAKQTKSRPTIAEIEALRPSVLERLTDAHDLDRELLTFARETFNSASPAQHWAPPLDTAETGAERGLSAREG